MGFGCSSLWTKKYANFDYDNLFEVGNLWEKICRTSRLVPCSANAAIGVGYVYDCFVAAGAACAFQGGHSWINAPCSWLAGALDYESMTKMDFGALFMNLTICIKVMECMKQRPTKSQTMRQTF